MYFNLNANEIDIITYFSEVMCQFLLFFLHNLCVKNSIPDKIDEPLLIIAIYIGVQLSLKQIECI